MITGKQLATKHTNVPIIASTGVNGVFKASRPQPTCNTKNDGALSAKSALKKEVEESSRNNKVMLNERNRVDSNTCVNNDVINLNSNAICKTCNECLFFGNHDACVVSFLKSSMQSRVKNILNAK
jgi:late competence protein required for DNA uptake (superfamily II DNA/RNA helicase)